MTRLDQNTFIVELGKLFDKHQTAGSVYISMTSGTALFQQLLVEFSSYLILSCPFYSFQRL